MYKVSSSEVINKLNSNFKEKYGDKFEAAEVVDKFFEYLVEYCIHNSACGIVNFGNFNMFKVYSNRRKRDVVRFKYRPSLSMMNRFNADQYILNNIPVSTTLEFNEKDESRVEGRRYIAEANWDAQHKYSGRYEKEKSKEIETKNALLGLLNNNSK